MWDVPWWTAMAIKRRQPWLKEQPPLWALAIFGCVFIVVVTLILWGIFAEVPQ